MYQTKDTNLKFLRSLPKEWRNTSISVRNLIEFKDYNLKKLYGVLKTYELEMEQDNDIKRNQRKDKSTTSVSRDEIDP